MIILLSIIFLPLLEIAGFIIIGGEIGLGLSLLWVILATMAGFHFLTAVGTPTLRRAKSASAEQAFPFEDLFDGLAVLVGALLLLFPGFLSDFVALPLLFPPTRSFIFRFLKYKHRAVFDDLSKNAQGFTYRYYGEERSASGSTIIEGDFTRVEDDKNLPKL